MPPYLFISTNNIMRGYMSLSFKSDFLENGEWFKSIKIAIKRNDVSLVANKTVISFELLNKGISLNCNGMSIQKNDATNVISGQLEPHIITALNTTGNAEINLYINCTPELTIALPTHFQVGGHSGPIPPEPKVDNLIQPDALTEKTYAINKFDPRNEDTKFSYTSARVLKNVYNQYAPSNSKIDGYYTSWSQYDGRLDGMLESVNCGRGVDTTKHLHNNYDKITLGFFALTGDQGEKKTTIAQAADQLKLKTFQVNPVDNWGMLLSYRNCTFEGWKTNEPLEVYNQKSAQGMLGALRKIKEANAEQKLAFSIGGWTMSQAFHNMVKSDTARKTFSKSVSDFLVKFPMFEEISIDWEYPGAPGAGNPYDAQDGKNYALLIKQLKQELTKAARPDVSISIAVSADPETLTKANIPGLIGAGVTKIHLMTYDFFGTPWSQELNHHTNLYHADEKTLSIDKAVTYLESLKIPMEHVYIGYANYSRNAKNATITSVSPLKGKYAPEESTTIGTFESGATESYDLLKNYYDPATGKGKNGFVLYTDTISNADFLYNPVSKVFMSIDTPRTVHAKGQYAKKHGLGGLFTWTIDMDNGLLSNAAHEGLDHRVIEQTIDMSTFYSSGLHDISDGEPYAANLLGGICNLI